MKANTLSKFVSVAVALVMAIALSSCSPKDNNSEIENMIHSLLDSMQSSEVNQAYKMFDTGILDKLSSISSDYVPKMTSEYTDRSIDSVTEFGQGENKSYLVGFSFNVGDDRIKEELEVKRTKKGLIFKSSPDSLFGAITISAEDIIPEDKSSPSDILEDMMIIIGGTPIRMDSNPSSRSWTINRVPVGDYQIDSYRESDIILFDKSDDTIKLRPSENKEHVIGMNLRIDSIDDTVQSSWESIKELIIGCSRTSTPIGSECNSSSHSLDESFSWSISHENLYMKSVDSANAQIYKPSRKDDSVIRVSIGVSGTIERNNEGYDSIMPRKETLSVMESFVTIDKLGNESYSVKLQKGLQ